MKIPNRFKNLSTLVAAIAIVGASTALGVSANSGQATSDVLKFKPEMTGVHQEIKQAMEKGDYETWSKLAAETPMGKENADKITEENFKKLTEAHRLREAGDKEGAKAILEELGIKPFQMKMGHHFSRDAFMDQLTEEQQAEVKKAMESKDPEAVKALMEEYGIEGPRGHGLFMMHGLEDDLTEEQKAELKQLHEDGATPEEMKAWFEKNGIDLPELPEFAHLTEEQKTALKEARDGGDKEAVKALMDEYGIQTPGMERREFRGELKELTEEQKTALKEARDGGDKEAVKALMGEYGMERPSHEGMKKMRGFKQNADAERESTEKENQDEQER